MYMQKSVWHPFFSLFFQNPRHALHVKLLLRKIYKIGGTLRERLCLARLRLFFIFREHADYTLKRRIIKNKKNNPLIYKNI